MKRFKLVHVVLVLGILAVVNCSHDIKELPDTWEDYIGLRSSDSDVNSSGASSSSALKGSSSSVTQSDVYCQVDGVCSPIPVPANMCLAVNGIPNCGTSSSSLKGGSSSSGTGGNSSSSGGSSSSAKLVYCEVGNTCEYVLETICSFFKGDVVLSCKISSSSSKGGSSSSGTGSNSSSSGGNSSSGGGNSSSGTSSSSIPISSSSSELDDVSEPESEGSGDFIIDSRDGKKYKVKKVLGGSSSSGFVWWMSENLNYSRNGTIGYCYGTGTTLGPVGAETSGCDTPYGRTYTYAMAMDGNTKRGLCPNGWHIPNETEWNAINDKILSDFYVLAGNYGSKDGAPESWKEREGKGGDGRGFYWTSDVGKFAFINGSYVDVQNVSAPVDYFSVRCMKD